MSKRWMISLMGVMAVLGFAAYLSLRTPIQPAAGFKETKNNPTVGSRPVQSASSPAVSGRPVAQDARLPEQAPSLVPATEVGRRGVFGSRHNSYARLRSASDLVSPGGMNPQTLSAASSAAQGQQAVASGPAVTQASNSGPGPEVAATNAPAQLGVANPAPATAPAAAPATSASAVLMPHGSVLLNGHPAADSTALFPGDRVQVPAGAYANINGKGSLTVLQPGSSVVYTGKGLDLQQGGIAVSTLGGMSVNTEGVSVAPHAGHEKYDVLDDNGTVQIASLEGDLDITDGGQTSVLTAGQQTTLDKRKKLAADTPDGPPAPETPPATASGGFPTGKVLLISGAVGGGVVAAILLTRSSSKPVSPAVP